MYVNRDYKVAFIHVPKTAGVSLVRYILEPIGYERFGGKPRHKGYIPGIVDDDYFVFAFVRNPYQRLVSLYRHQCLKKRGFRENYPTLTSFLEREIKEHDRIQTPFRQVDYLAPCVEVFKYEEHAKSIKEICKRLDLSPPKMQKNGENNCYGQYDWHDWITEKDIEFINDYFLEDFSLGYEQL
jgi:hypothetical protein